MKASSTGELTGTHKHRNGPRFRHIPAIFAFSFACGITPPPPNRNMLTAFFLALPLSQEYLILIICRLFCYFQDYECLFSNYLKSFDFFPILSWVHSVSRPPVPVPPLTPQTLQPQPQPPTTFVSCLEPGLHSVPAAPQAPPSPGRQTSGGKGKRGRKPFDLHERRWPHQRVSGRKLVSVCSVSA